ncbi:MAG TPA: transglycosylase SLT domain-containing protein, partial [Methylomirabilota bacterium]|nr:transglycosylase SLT domain-containing protein [Methylomirabilota bacterium]
MGQPRTRRISLILSVALFLLSCLAWAQDSRVLPDAGSLVQSSFLALQAGDFPAAAAGFARIAQEVPLLADYADFFLAQSFAATGRLEDARQLLTAFPLKHPTSRFVPAALLFSAYLASATDDEAGAEAVYRIFIDRFPLHPDTPEARYLLALSLSSQARRDESGALFMALWLDAPGTAYGEAAGDQLNLLLAQGVAIRPPTLANRFARIERLLTNGSAAMAKEELEDLPAYGADRSSEPRRKWLLAQTSYALGQWEAAGRLFREAHRIAPSEWHPRLSLGEARALAKANRKSEAVAALQRVNAWHRSTPERRAALLFVARLLSETGKLEAARTHYRRLVADHPESEEGAEALWALAWEGFSGRRYTEAGQRFEQLADWKSPESTALAAAYWAGRSRDAQRDPGAAARHYERVIRAAPRSYYGFLASRRLGRSYSPIMTASRSMLPVDPATELAQDPHFQKADLLRALRAFDFARAFIRAELEEVQKSAFGEPAKLYGLAMEYLREGEYHLALRIVRRFFGDLIGAAHDLPQPFWEIAYPLGWKDEIKEVAETHGLDPLFVAAVIREESSFFPKARSRVGAMGLMQLMPYTARLLAGPALPIPDGLENPVANLRLGTRFLSDLLKQFADPRLAVAAY